MLLCPELDYLREGVGFIYSDSDGVEHHTGSKKNLSNAVCQAEENCGVGP